MPDSTRILIVEDEQNLARFIELELEHEGYAPSKAFNGREGLELATAERFDLILLDVMLPELNGMEVLRRLRKGGASAAAPVIILTARDGVMDKVSGLDLGADDYVTKPFAIEELLARIRAALRKRSSAPDDDELEISGVALNPRRREVTANGTPVELSKREFDLLEYLMRNRGIVLTRDQLLDNVWNFDFDGGTNTVDVYVRFLRQKIDEAFGIKLISTVRGVGYVIK